MKALKSTGQVLAAIVYTCIYTGLLYMILVLPLTWLLTLKTAVMILTLVILGGIIQFVIIGAHTLLLMPYMWIVKNNVVALVISICLMLFNLIRSDVTVWKSVLGHGSSAVVVAVIITVFIVEALISSIISVLSLYSDSKERYYSYRKEIKKQVPKINSSITQSGSNNTENGLILISNMEKGDIFPVEYDGKRYWAMLDEHTIDYPVLSLYDNDRAEDNPVPGYAGIDDMTYEMWEAVRVKSI